ncbi:hypothetical protein J5X84_12740 [Streptosporangiaceae bacterium NEAU-GS5]|nr:hypothetical protein [Streptosporangiaceae bacterium NEAU-GS5]
MIDVEVKGGAPRRRASFPAARCACGVRPGDRPRAATAVQRRAGLPPEAAAASLVQLARDPSAIPVSWAFFGPRRRLIRVPERAANPARRAEVWAASEAMVHPWLAIDLVT